MLITDVFYVVLAEIKLFQNSVLEDKGVIILNNSMLEDTGVL